MPRARASMAAAIARAFFELDLADPEIQAALGEHLAGAMAAREAERCIARLWPGNGHAEAARGFTIVPFRVPPLSKPAERDDARAALKQMQTTTICQGRRNAARYGPGGSASTSPFSIPCAAHDAVIGQACFGHSE